MLDDLCRRAAPFVARLAEIGFAPKATAHLRATLERRLADLAA
jgi:hypothetical protein